MKRNIYKFFGKETLYLCNKAEGIDLHDLMLFINEKTQEQIISYQKLDDEEIPDKFTFVFILYNFASQILNSIVFKIDIENETLTTSDNIVYKVIYDSSFLWKPLRRRKEIKAQGGIKGLINQLFYCADEESALHRICFNVLKEYRKNENRD